MTTPDVEALDRGGVAALRGFRLQALYVLHRTLTSLGDDERVQPEGAEDLGVHRGGHLVEACQIKARTQALTLSDLEPEKKGGFVHRQVRRLHSQADLAIRIASYGPIGPELTRAAGPGGTGRERIRKRLAEVGIAEADADLLLDRLVLEQVREVELSRAVVDLIAETLMGHDPQSALEVLLFWIHQASERQELIDASAIMKRLTRVGAYLADRAAHAAEWFTTIEPLDDRVVSNEERSRLLAEFDVGVAARYEHVLAGAAVPRPAMLNALTERLSRARVVVVHGASGEGKSTLALAFLASLPAVWRFRVREIEGRARGLSVARALLGHARALELPVYVHLDVGPSDAAWPVVARELSRDPEVNVIVTVREEDWRRASLQGEFLFEELEVTLAEEEAETIYGSLRDRHAETPLTFAEAWARFGAAPGPLLEFVHLCTQGQGLEQRLASQVRRLREEVRTAQVQPSELELLRLVAVAGAFDAAVDAQLLVEALNLPDPARTIERFEREYLLRRGAHGLVTGLHPVRSEILVSLLCDETYSPWAPAAANVVPAVAPSHLERFLLYSLARRPHEDRAHLLAVLVNTPCRTWEQASAIGRALLWRGLADYVEENRGVIEALRRQFPGYWHLMLNWDVALLGTDAAADILDRLAELSGAFDKAREGAADLAALQTDPLRSYGLFRGWIEACPGWPSTAPSQRDWPGLGDLLFWAQHLGVAVDWLDHLDATGWRQFVEDGSVQEIATASRGLALSGAPSWYSETLPMLADRFREATASPVLVDDGGEVSIKFIFDPTSQTNGMDPHAATMWRIGLLRRLFPDRDRYACHGYGHRLFDEALDGTTKAIPAKNLPHEDLAGRNGCFLNLAELWWRAPGWLEYWLEEIEQRRRAVHASEGLTSLVRSYFRRPAAALDGDSVDDLTEALTAIGDSARLPRIAVDEWGFVSESTAKGGEQPSPTAWSGVALEQLRPYWKAHRDYLSGWDAFARQASHALVLWPALARSTDRATVQEQARSLGIEEHLAKLSMLNLGNAAAALPALCRESMALVPTPLRAGLASLCEEEQMAIDAALLAWQGLSTASHARSADVVADQRVRRERLMKRVRSAIAAGLRSSVTSARWSVQPVAIAYDGEAAMLVAGEWDRYGDALAGVVDAAAAVGSVLRTLSDPDKQSVAYLAPNIVIAQMVKGRLAWPEVVVLRSQALAYGEGNPKWFNLVPKPIDEPTLTSWGLARWDEPTLAMGDPLLVSVVGTYLHLRHISDLTIDDDLDELGTSIAQRHLDNVSRIAQAQLDGVFEHASQMVGMLRDRGEPALADDLGQILIDFADTIGEGFTVAGLATVLEQAERVLEAATIVRAVWFDLVLDDLTAPLLARQHR